MGKTGHKRGSTKVANVKIRPAPAPEDIAQPRKKAGKSTFNNKGKGKARQLDSDDDDEERSADEEDEEITNQFQREDVKPLRGMLVCATGTLGITREETRQICDSLGAVFETALTIDTTFLVADATEGDKYRAAVENGIPVLHSDFLAILHQQWIEGQNDINVLKLSDTYRLPPFSGLNICLTGYDATSLKSSLISHLTSAGGGNYDPTLGHSITHLVVGPQFSSTSSTISTNGKVKAAMSINAKRRKDPRKPALISIVWGEWVEHSLHAFGRLREQAYALENVQEKSNIVAPRFVRTDDIVTRLRESPNKKKKLEGRSASGKIPGLLREETVIVAKPDSSSGSSSRSAKRSREEDSTDAKPHSKLRKASRPIETEQSEDMDGEGEVEVARVRKEEMARQEAAQSTSSARPVVKKQRSGTTAEVASIQDLLQPVDTTRASNGSSIQGGLSRQGSSSTLSKVSVDRSSKFASASSSVSQSTTSKAAPAPSVAVKMEAETQSIPASLAPQNMMMQEDGGPEEEEDISPIFEGQRLYLHMPGISSTLIKRLRGVIEERAGTVVDKCDKDVNWIICKWHQTEPLPFVADDERIVTDVWLETCMFFDALVPFSDDCYSMRRPLYLPVHPLPKASSYRFSYAGFDECGRTLIPKFCKALGSECSEKLRKNDTTHLIVPDGSYRSTRLGTAQAWGITIVFPDWLRVLAEKSTRQCLQGGDVSTGGEGNKTASVANSEVERHRSRSQSQATGPLRGSTICVSQKLTNKKQLQSIAESLGAFICYSIVDTPSATHLIFQSKKAKDPNRDFRAAQEGGKYIVHPKWLLETEKASTRQPEAAYRHTMDASRSLDLGLSMSRSTSGSGRSTLSVGPDVSAAEGDQSGIVNGEMEEDDEFSLPPPLRKPGAEEPAPSMAGIDTNRQSTPRIARTSRPSESGGLQPSSSATIYSPEQSKTRGASTPLDDPTLPDEPTAIAAEAAAPRMEDSGFVPSADKRKLLSAPNGLSTSSPGSSPRPLPHTNLDEKLNKAPSSDPASNGSDSAPSGTALTRDLLAEMKEIMEAHQPEQAAGAIKAFSRIPGQAASTGRLAARRPVFKQRDSPASAPLPAAVLTAKTAVHTTDRQRNGGYTGLYESQFGGPGHYGETQETQNEESAMIIRISDPTAEAAKARLLAGIRANQQQSVQGQ